MATTRDYIPNRMGDFATWQANLVTKVAAAPASWGLPAPKVTELQAKQTAYLLLYNKITDPNTKTKGAVEQHADGRKTYEKYLRGFVKEFLVNNSAISIEEKISLGINPGTNAGSSRPAIDEEPLLQLRARGALQIVVQVRTETDSTRPSIHPLADGVEIRYTFGSTPPAGVAECREVFFSTKARFKKTMSADVEGKSIYMYARWSNTTDDTKNSGWSQVESVVVR